MKSYRLGAFLLIVVIFFLNSCSQSPRDEGSLVSTGSHTKSGIIVAIDAGHGGEDFGTHSNIKPRQHEKFLTLSTAFMVRDHLKRMGYKAVFIRSKDEFVPLRKRIAIASSQKATILVSVHYNSAANVKAHGVEVYYYRAKNPTNRTRESAKLAEAVLKHVLGYTKAKSRGVKHGDFCVVRDSTMPAILVEGGFLTNAMEVKKLKNPRYVNDIARGIAQGIDDYFMMR